MPRLSNLLVIFLVAAALVVAAERATAQMFSPPFRSYGTGGYPNSVAIADLDADGRSDLVTANWASSSVSVLLGYGGGAFGSQTSFPTGINPSLVAIADVNADGRPDVATANYTSGTVSVLLGNGDGTFGPKTDFGTGSHPGSLAIRDLNGDGRLDLAVANGGSNTVSVLLGNGDGTFGTHTDYDAGNRPTSVAIGDLNGDGRFDLAVADIGTTPPPPPVPCEYCYGSDSSYVSVLMGNGDGTFGARSGFRCAPDPQYVVISDLNADGRPDLTTANDHAIYHFTSFSVLLGVGNGTFLPATTDNSGPSSLAIADLDADGRLDLVGTRGNAASFWHGNGDGTFGSRIDFGLSPGGRSLAVGELNGDGRPDLAVAGGFYSNTVTVLLHADPTRVNTTLALSSSPDRADPGQSMFLTAVISAQAIPSGLIRFFDVTNGAVEVGSAPLVNGTASFAYGPLGSNRTVQALYDGDSQYQGSVSNQVSIEIFVGAGMFSQPTLFNTGSSPVLMVTSDLNADGRPDLVTANASPELPYPAVAGVVSVLLGSGNGSFNRLDFPTGAISSWSVAVGDLNGDGRPDLVTANTDMSTPGGNAVSVLLGNGDGTFGPKTIFPTGMNPASVAIGDLNADGKPDLVTADSYPNTASVLLGNGNGTFAPKTTFPAGNEPQCVVISDLNADGRLDLVLANAGSNSISVLLGNGNGTFGPQTDFLTGFRPFSVAIADLNSDGRLDLVTANSGLGTGNTVSVLLGNGNGTFGPKTDFGTGSYPVSVTIGDIDGDGRLDLAVANRSSNTVSVLPGNGDGTFQAKRDYKTGASTPFSVAIADFNADSRPDLAVTNANGAGTVGVLLNLGPPTCSPRPMSFDLNPNTLNLQSLGHWVTGTLEPEPPASPSDIDVASIRLNGSVPVDASAPTSIGDADSDGRPDLTVKFDRAAVELAVTEGDAIPVTVAGTIGNGCFSATDVIRIVRGHVTAPAEGAVLQGGSTTDVRWDTPAGVQVQSVAVLWSSDDGASWSLVANGQPNSGSYLWSLPTSGTSAARVAVVLVESADPSGYEVTGVLGVSGRFGIATPLGVNGPRAELALHGPVTNPSARLTVSFSLPDAEPASLVAYDVSGRELDRSAVGALGAGRHVVTLGASRNLAPGVYLVHLIRRDRRLVARTVVVR